ncbi:hypothetical protein [Chitinophaga qingshengii]|uniref:MarR family transcriptional regulator n=1 Tax=Chitinophaga qingshengii TaxID=1569794 RepID=A0ABR7TVR3_9BACT|nr:hypothetical protein [Chitinophaga qingshengii]MBC9934517.1 hypothetical protein [Chitinophaga qingshengii]
MEHHKPIGWYLKEADSLITATFANAFESYGLTRFHWQLLKNIADNGEVCTKDYYPQVACFITEDILQTIIASLEKREWITWHNEVLRFTAAGADAYADIEARQKILRDQMLKGTRPQDYTNTIIFLDSIIQNLRALPQVQP